MVILFKKQSRGKIRTRKLNFCSLNLLLFWCMFLLVYFLSVLLLYFCFSICERIWEKGPYRAKNKLKLWLEIPLRVNAVPTFFFSMTKNYPFPIFSPNLKSNSYLESTLTASFPRETIKKALPERQASSVVFYENIEIATDEKAVVNAYNFSFLLGKDTLKFVLKLKYHRIRLY